MKQVVLYGGSLPKHVHIYGLGGGVLRHGHESIGSAEGVDTSVSESVVGPGAVVYSGADLAREGEVAVRVVLEDGLHGGVAHVAVPSPQETNETSDMRAGH